MAGKRRSFLFCGVIYSLCTSCQTQEFCRSMNYWCKEGHCCGRGKCCTYYYELWWFWFVWLAIAVAGICCFYQKKVKHTPLTRRFFRRRSPEERVRNTETATNTEPTTDTHPLDPDKVFQLPSYEESRDMSKDPPSYAQIFGPSLNLPETEIPTLPPPPLPVPPCGPPAYSLPATETTILPSSEDLPPQYTSQPLSNQLSYCEAGEGEESQGACCSEDAYATEESLEAGLLSNAEPIATSSTVRECAQ